MLYEHLTMLSIRIFSYAKLWLNTIKAKFHLTLWKIQILFVKTGKKHFYQIKVFQSCSKLQHVTVVSVNSLEHCDAGKVIQKREKGEEGGSITKLFAGFHVLAIDSLAEKLSFSVIVFSLERYFPLWSVLVKVLLHVLLWQS